MFNSPPHQGPLRRAFLLHMETSLRQAGLPLPLRLVRACLLRKRDVSLPITARQMNALKALQRKGQDLGELAIAIAQAFDATRIENPEPR